MGLIAKSGSPALGALVWASMASSLYALVRWGFVRHVGTKRQELRELVEELARFAQANVTSARGAQGVLPAGPPGRVTSTGSPSAGR